MRLEMTGQTEIITIHFLSFVLCVCNHHEDSDDYTCNKFYNIHASNWTVSWVILVKVKKLGIENIYMVTYADVSSSLIKCCNNYSISIDDGY